MNKLSINACPLCGGTHLRRVMTCTDFYASGERFDVMSCEDCGFTFTQDVPVEAEIGELLRLDEAGAQMENKNVANPEQVRQFLNLCQPDSLAIGIGNAHGYYKGEPDIKLEVLEEVRKFTDIPFVLHGCTGMREDIIKEAIKLGVAKINFGTEIRYKYVEHYNYYHILIFL